MNIGSKSKKRVVLPSRPDPPTVDHILEDINRAAPNDPVFSILDQHGQDPSRPSDSDVELRFQQCRQYLELNERLQEVRGRLLHQREELQAAGEQLEKDVAETDVKFVHEMKMLKRSDLPPLTDRAWRRRKGRILKQRPATE